jgi:hypothetical protein
MKSEKFIVFHLTTLDRVVYEKAQSVPSLSMSIVGWTTLPLRLSPQQLKEAREKLSKELGAGGLA